MKEKPNCPSALKDIHSPGKSKLEGHPGKPVNASYSSMRENSFCTSYSSNSINTSIIDDLSLMLEKSFLLKSSKYVEKKTRIAPRYIKFAYPCAVYPFIITICRRCGYNAYSGYDSSSYCILLTKESLVRNMRYLVYGKVRFRRAYILEALKVQPVNYKVLCYYEF